MDIDYDTYFKYHDQSYIIIEKIADNSGIELKVLGWVHIRDYQIIFEDIKMFLFHFVKVPFNY